MSNYFNASQRLNIYTIPEETSQARTSLLHLYVEAVTRVLLVKSDERILRIVIAHRASSVTRLVLS